MTRTFFTLGKIDHANVEVLRIQRPGFDVILDAFRQSAENKLEAGASRLRPHGHLFPFGGALVAGVQADILRLQADELRGHH